MISGNSISLLMHHHSERHILLCILLEHLTERHNGIRLFRPCQSGHTYLFIKAVLQITVKAVRKGATYVSLIILADSFILLVRCR